MTKVEVSIGVPSVADLSMRWRKRRGYQHEFVGATTTSSVSGLAPTLIWVLAKHHVCYYILQERLEHIYCTTS